VSVRVGATASVGRDSRRCEKPSNTKSGDPFTFVWMFDERIDICLSCLLFFSDDPFDLR